MAASSFGSLSNPTAIDRSPTRWPPARLRRGTLRGIRPRDGSYYFELKHGWRRQEKSWLY
jgi:hypothetical protein